MNLTLLFFYISICSALAIRISLSPVTSIRGGLVPEATPDGEYYEKFQLDYGCEDNVRLAGRMMGLLKPGKISSLVEKDPLFSWLNEKLERGPQAPTTRFKPYYVQNRPYQCLLYVAQVTDGLSFFRLCRRPILERKLI